MRDWDIRLSYTRPVAATSMPTLVIAGQYDTWSYPEDREGLMRDLVHAPVKKNVLIPDATHFVLFEKNRAQFFRAIEEFLSMPQHSENKP
jgi:alpha-beta hydrolase superfamily lysophospholipase